ncbi:MAG: hypothetical protein MRY64_03420 [Hyphomonadaceae bacterium]|nr:hypothetical protein [Hyphomonadaceae bacterium]
MTFRRLLMSAGTAVILAACTPASETPATPETDTASVETETVDIPAPPAEPAADLELDGASAERIEHSNQPAFYVLSFSLESAPGQPATEYSDTSPAMPLLSPGLAIYLEGDSYKLVTKGMNDERADVLGGSVGEHTRFDVVNTGQGAAIFIDGTTAWTGERLRQLDYTQFGQGFRQRFWAGKVYDLNICGLPDGLTLASATADPASIQCPES